MDSIRIFKDNKRKTNINAVDIISLAFFFFIYIKIT